MAKGMNEMLRNLKAEKELEALPEEEDIKVEPDKVEAGADVTIDSEEVVKPEDADKLILHIDPGTAFGTGMHETTQLVIRQIKKILQIVNTGIKGKPPFTSAEHLQAVGAFSIPYNHVVSGRGRYIISPVRLGILVQDREVFIKTGNDQSCCLLSYKYSIFDYSPNVRISKKNL